MQSVLSWKECQKLFQENNNFQKEQNHNIVTALVMDGAVVQGELVMYEIQQILGSEIDKESFLKLFRDFPVKKFFEYTAESSSIHSGKEFFNLEPIHKPLLSLDLIDFDKIAASSLMEISHNETKQNGSSKVVNFG